MEIKFKVEVIPHDKQRYDTVGDYQLLADGTWWITVSDLGNPKYNFLVALHEITELYLTQFADIKEEDITNFDLFYEKSREMKLVNEFSEPGFDTNAPYRKQHTIATGIEMLLAAELGVDWNEYDRKVNSL
jgi:hypothetical protein